MPRYVKSEPGYDQVEFEARKIRKTARRPKRAHKQPTSVALDPELIKELKSEAAARGVPYQVLMSMFIIQGFRRLRKAS